MSRLCRLKTASHGDDGKWAYNEIVSLRKQRDELLSDIERTYKMLLSEPDTQGALFKAENILREALASVKGEQ